MAFAASYGGRAFKMRLVYVADRGDGDARLLHGRFEVFGTHQSDADKSGGDAVVGALCGGAENRRPKGRSHKVSTFHGVLFS